LFELDNLVNFRLAIRYAKQCHMYLVVATRGHLLHLKKALCFMMVVFDTKNSVKCDEYWYPQMMMKPTKEIVTQKRKSDNKGNRAGGSHL